VCGAYTTVSADWERAVCLIRLSQADPHGPFTSCQSRGPQRGALPSALPEPELTQQESG